MRKYWLLLMLLFLALVPTNANASASFINYGPVGTISAPYPAITALVHTYNSYVMLNETTLYLNTIALPFAAAVSNSFPNGADIAITYQSNKWLAEGTYTVRLDVSYVTGSSTTRSTLTQQWAFTVTYDAATKAMFAINSTLVSVNSTAYGLRHDYDATLGQWIPTLQVMNNTMHYWNSTIQNTYNVITNIQNMFQSGGTIYAMISDAKDYIFYGLAGVGVLLLIGIIALAVVIVRRTGHEPMPSSRQFMGGPPAPAPSYPGYPMQQPQPMPQPQGMQPAPSLVGGSPICPSCGHTNRPQARFCANCKTALVQGGSQPS